MRSGRTLPPARVRRKAGFARGDIPAAANLLGRAAELLPEDDLTRLELLPELGEALLQVGRFQEAAAVLDEAIERAERGGANGTQAHASLVRLLVRLRAGGAERWQDEAAGTIAEAMAVFEAAGDHGGLAKAWRLLAWAHGTDCRLELMAEAQERALEQALLAGDARQRNRSAAAYAVAAVFGPTPVSEAIDRSEEMLVQVSGDRPTEGVLLGYLASLLAMEGSFDRGRELVARGRAMLEELGLGVEGALVDIEAWRIEMLAGDPVAAERELERAYDALDAAGERFIRSTVAGLLADTHYELNGFEEVRRFGSVSEELAADDDIDAQALWRRVRGKILALDGSLEDAEASVREALEILAPTDALLFKFQALLDVAEVCRLAGREDRLEMPSGRRVSSLG